MTNMQYIADNLIEDATILNGLTHIDTETSSSDAFDCCVTSGGYIVVADGANGVDTYSQSSGILTNTHNETSSSDARGCAVTADGYIVIADNANGVDTYSIDGSGLLTHVDNETSSGEAYGCCVTSGGYIVVADGANGVDTYSIDAFGVLTHEDNETSSSDAWDCCVTADGYIVVSDGTNGVDTYSIDGAGTLTHEDNETTSIDARGCAVTTDGYIVIADNANGVDTYSQSSGILTHVDNDTTSTSAFGCCITLDGYIVVADGLTGIDVYSHSDGVLTYLDTGLSSDVALGCSVTIDGHIVTAGYTEGVHTDRFDYVPPTATYPITNIYNKRPGKPLLTSAKTYTILVDFATPTALTCATLIGHNIDSGATITLEGNASNIWNAPSKSESITWAETNMYEIFTTGSYRYWRLVVSGTVSNIKIGEYVLGVVSTLTNNYQWGSEKAKRYKNITQTTEYGQPWSNYLFNQRSYNLTFVANDTTVTELETLHEDVQGGNKPFAFINWDEEAVYVRLEDELNFKRTFTNYNESKIELLEVPLGKDI